MWTVSQAAPSNACTVQVLQKAGLSDAQLVQLNSNLYQLQCAFERMAVIKEYRYRHSCLASLDTLSGCPSQLACDICFVQLLLKRECVTALNNMVADVDLDQFATSSHVCVCCI